MRKLVFLILSLFSIINILAQQVDSIIDIRDDQIYKVVKIGQQWWMQENLNIGTRIDGFYAADNEIIEKYCYNNHDSMCNIYGGLYQWDEMMDYNPSDNGNPGVTKGVCPVGWHLPTDDEWTEMTDFLGGESVAGGKLKEAGTTHWIGPNTGATNESGFIALPGGYRNNGGSFSTIGNIGYWWSATGEVNPVARARNLYYNNTSVISNIDYKNNGFSVRCIRDSSQFSYLTIINVNLITITKLDFNYYRPTDTIIIINSSPEKTINVTSIHINTSVFNLNKSSSVLLPGDSVHLKITFNPPSKLNYYYDTLHIESDDPYKPVISVPLDGYMNIDTIIDIRDDQIYSVVKIGQQVWMQENLNVGTRINGSQDAVDNGTIEKYCYNNLESNCDVYGGLYQWDEMMDYNPSDNGNPGIVRGFCPVGWHLPTDNEWTELTDFLGGEAVAGGKLKEAGTIHWSINPGATNESGFTALPGGYRSDDGYFYYLGLPALFWSSTEYYSYGAWSWMLRCDSSGVYRNIGDENYGFSVRCLRDSSQFGYLTISDKNYRSVFDLDFYGDNIIEELILINSSAIKTITISSIYNKNSVYALNKSSATLSPGDSIHLTIIFDPPDKNIYPDTLFVKSDDPYDSLITIPLNGTFPPEISFTDSTNISCFGYSDGSATVTPLLGTPPYQFRWDDPGNATNSTIEGLEANISYHVTVTDSEGWSAKDSIMLSEPEPLEILSDYSEIICFGTNIGYINLNPEGGTPPYDYTWSNSAAEQALTNLEAGSYSVKVADSQGCKDSATFTINIATPYSNEKICIVTIDMVSGKYLLVWGKTPGKGIKSYNIYREEKLIGTSGYNDLSIFLDTEADPEKRPYLYKISVADTCDNESVLSPYHKPIFLQYVSSEEGVMLIWSKYEIEGQVLNFDSYTIYRGSDSTALSPLEENIPKEIDVYTDNDPNALIKKYYYRVAGVLTDPCFPTGASGRKAETEPYSHSMSNLEDNRLKTVIEAETINKESLSVHPNPFNKTAILEFNNPEGHSYTLYIMDISGKVCRIVDNINSSKYILEREGLKEGFYFIELSGPEVMRGKIIVE